ncbi:DUF1963 domain-containing protein [Actinomadura sp. 6N118]|uniref:DUF1963 domain-containing protein n=1 Tax=Actinomadura sp. 6N118 TaxID=3375151 RepID=UPI0037AE996E
MDHFAAQHQRLRSLFGVFFAPEVTGALLPLARPALRLGPDGDATVLLGGTPLLPPGEEWPTWEGRPLDFMLSVDFAELAKVMDIPGLPKDGQAAFFYASALPRPWGDDRAQRDGWRLFTGDLHDVEPAEGTSSFPMCPLGAAPFLSLPAPQETVVRRLEERYSGVLPVYEQLHAAWLQHVWPDDTPLHQLGGWPVLVQRPLGPDCTYASTGRDLDAMALSPEEELAAENQWQLLLQLDSDRRLGWDWGAPGRVYFCVNSAGRLEDTWLTLQAAVTT